MVTSTVTFRRIRTAAGLPPRPSGTPLINAGGKGTVLIFGAFRIASAYQEIATACGLAMTVVNDGWNFYFAWAVDDGWSAGAMPPALRVWCVYKKGGSCEPPLRGIRDYLAQRNRKVTT